MSIATSVKADFAELDIQLMRIVEQKKKEKQVVSLFCVPREARTLDPLIKSQLLYQLS